MLLEKSSLLAGHAKIDDARMIYYTVFGTAENKLL